MRTEDSHFRKHCKKARFIYALCEPGQDFAPRYVGCCVNLKSRINNHKKRSHAARVDNWLESIGRNPRVVVLETAADWWAGGKAERWWIEYLLGQGHHLLNRSNAVITEKYIDDRCVSRDAKRWATKLFHSCRKVARDRFRASRLATAGGRTLTLGQWSDELGVRRDALYLRLKKYPPEIALSSDFKSKLRASTCR